MSAVRGNDNIWTVHTLVLLLPFSGDGPSIVTMLVEDIVVQQHSVGPNELFQTLNPVRDCHYAGSFIT